MTGPFVTMGEVAGALGCANENAAMLAAAQALREELTAARRQIDDLRAANNRPASSFQARVDPWLIACFGEAIARDRIERNHRFLEEALELVQANGCTADEAHQLVDYVYDRPPGEPSQEVGGVMTTLAALCLASGLDMHAAGEDELVRIWAKVQQIRAKQAAKPKHSPLPEHVRASTPHPVGPPSRDDLVEHAARAIVRGRGATVNASDEVWPGVVANYRRMCRQYPDYAGSWSLINDAFRDARNALEAVQAARAVDGGPHPRPALAPASEAAS